MFVENINLINKRFISYKNNNFWNTEKLKSW